MVLAAENVSQFPVRKPERLFFPRKKTTMGFVSDLHWGGNNPEGPKKLVDTVLANEHMNVLVLGGDVVSKNSSSDDLERVFQQLARLKEAPRTIHVAIVEGNDEARLADDKRKKFYQRLGEKGITVFESGTKNVLTVTDEHKKPVVSIVGIPWTLPPETYQDVYNSSKRHNFFQNYEREHNRLYKDQIIEAVKEAEKAGVPIIAAFHVPPFPEFWPLRRAKTPQDKRQVNEVIQQAYQNLWIINLFKTHPLLAGIVIGHISEGPSDLVSPGFLLAAVNTCQQVVNRHNEEQVFEVTLPRKHRGARLARLKFFLDAKLYAWNRRKYAKQRTGIMSLKEIQKHIQKAA